MRPFLGNYHERQNGLALLTRKTGTFKLFSKIYYFDKTKSDNVIKRNPLTRNVPYWYNYHKLYDLLVELLYIEVKRRTAKYKLNILPLIKIYNESFA